MARDLENITEEPGDDFSRDVPRLKKGAGCLEIFAGCGQLSACLRKFGDVFPPVDIRDGPCFDMRFKKLQAVVFDHIRQGNIAYVHLGTPCTARSISRTRIRNKIRARKLEMEAVKFALFTAEVIRCCHRHGVLWSVENPLSSKLWSFDPVSKLHSLPGTAEIIFDMCHYGSQFKKPTKILSNIAGLSKLSARCTRNHNHTAAQGTQKVFVDGISKHVRNTTLFWCLSRKVGSNMGVSRLSSPSSSESHWL